MNKQGKKSQAGGLLWNADPRLDSAKQVLLVSDDNWLNTIESKFVRASISRRQRDKRIGQAAAFIILALALGFSGYFWFQLQLSQLREKAARAENLLQTDDPVEGLVLAIQIIGQNRSTWIVNWGIFHNPVPEVQMSLSSAVQTVREGNRFQVQDGSRISLTAVAFSPNGKTIASGAEDGTVTLWDTSTGNPLTFPSQVKSAPDKVNQVNAIVFSRDGQQILSGREDGTVQLWDLQGNLQGEWRHDQGVTSVASTADNESEQGVTSVAFIADNEIVSSSRDGSIYLRNLAQNPDQPQVLAGKDENSSVTPAFVTVSQDGTRIAAVRARKILFGNSQDKVLVPLREESDSWGLPVDTLKSRCAIAFSDNQTLLIGQGSCSSAEGTITKYNFEVQKWEISGEGSVKPVGPISGENVAIESVAGAFGVIASDSSDNSILLEKEGGKIMLTGHTEDVNMVAFNPTNSQQLVSVGDDGTMRLWDISELFQNVKYQGLQFEGKTVEVDEEHVHDYVTSTAFSPDGNNFAISRKNLVMLFDAQGQLARRPFKAGDKVDVKAVAFSPDGKTIVSGSSDNSGNNISSNNVVQLWDLAGNLLHTFEGHEYGVTTVAFSPDGQTIISGSEDKTVRIWDAATRQSIGEPLTGHEGRVNSVTFSPDGKVIVSGSEDKMVRIWDAATRQSIGEPLTGHEGRVNSVAFSPNGKVIVSGSDDRTIRFWNLQGKTYRAPISNAHRQKIKSVLFKDKNTIVSASSDQTIKFWNFDSSSKLFKLFKFWNRDGSSATKSFLNRTEAVTPPNTTLSFNSNNNLFLSSIDISKESGSHLRLFKDPDDWQYLLQTACQQLKQHRVLMQPMTDVTQEAKETCEKYAWNLPQPLEQHDNISIGDKILVSTPISFSKQAGVEAIRSGDFTSAIQHLEAHLKNEPNDPEALIYLNNARVGTQASYTLAVSAPIGSDVNGALELLRGVAQAQNELNQTGGINETLLRIVIADDSNEPDIAKQIAEIFVNDPNVMGVIGHYASDVTLAVGETYEAGKLAAISPVSTSVKLTGFGNYIFRTVPSDSVAANALVDYVRSQLGVSNVAIFHNSQSDYSESLKSEFLKFLKESQEQDNTLTFDLSESNFDAIQSVEQAITSGAKALILLTNTAELDDALQVVNANNQRLPILAGDDVYTPKTLEIGTANVEGMVVAVPWHILASQTDFPNTSRQLWDADVNWRTAMSYDATVALIAGLQENPTREGIAQFLRSQEVIANGATGTIQFDQKGDRDRTIQLVEIKDTGAESRSGFGYDFVPAP